MKKVKRYNEEGYVTSDDSNAGMKEKYNADQLADNFDDYGSKRGAGAAGTSESTTEEAGSAMLKSMRDAATKPKPKPKATSSTTKSAPSKSTSSGAMDTAGFEKSSAPDVTKMSLSERIKAKALDQVAVKLTPVLLANVCALLLVWLRAVPLLLAPMVLLPKAKLAERCANHG